VSDVRTQWVAAQSSSGFGPKTQALLATQSLETVETVNGFVLTSAFIDQLVDQAFNGGAS
jgi:hypothetical protein